MAFSPLRVEFWIQTVAVILAYTGRGSAFGQKRPFRYIVLPMKNVYVVTHTESIHHIEGKVGGWYDSGLTQLGIAQARRTAERLQILIKGDSPKITSSDLLRAKETAEIIGAAFGSEIQTNPSLREMSYGAAEGLPQAWLDERISPAPDDNRLDHLSIEQGETKRDFISRIYRALDEIVCGDAPTHVIVTHGFALTFVVARWIKMPEESAGFVNFRASPGGITHLQQDDFWRNRGVQFLNDTSHLAE